MVTLVLRKCGRIPQQKYSSSGSKSSNCSNTLGDSNSHDTSIAVDRTGIG